jgi:hypothetical protein
MQYRTGKEPFRKMNSSKPFFCCLMEQHALKNINNCWNANISFYLETYDDQNTKSIFKCFSFFQHQC